MLGTSDTKYSASQDITIVIRTYSYTHTQKKQQRHDDQITVLGTTGRDTKYSASGDIFITVVIHS